MAQPSVTNRKIPYEEVEEKELILRDLLAAERTVLANERTLLAYIRTALALFAAGAGLIHFFTSGWLHITGWLLIPIAPIVTLVGIWRYFRVRRDMAKFR